MGLKATPPTDENIISLWEKTPVKAHFYRVLACVFSYLPLSIFTWNSLREKMSYSFRSYYLEAKLRLKSNTNKSQEPPKNQIIPEENQKKKKPPTINETQASIATTSTTETEINTTNPAYSDQTNLTAATNLHIPPRVRPLTPPRDYTPTQSNINSDDKNEDTDSDTSSITTLERISITGSSDDESEDDDVVSTEFHNQNITATHLSTDKQTDESDSDGPKSDTDQITPTTESSPGLVEQEPTQNISTTRNYIADNEAYDSDTSSIFGPVSVASSDDERVGSTNPQPNEINDIPSTTDIQTDESDSDNEGSDNNSSTNKKQQENFTEDTTVTTTAPLKPTLPLFMKSDTELQSPEVIIKHFTEINIGDKAQKIVNNLSNNFLSQEQLHSTLIKDAKLSLDPKAVTTLKTNITDIVTKLIQTLLTEPQKLGPTLKKNVSDTLIALLALNQNNGNGIDLISYKKFAENLALFVPPFVLALFKQCVPAATDLSEKVFDKLDTSVSEYVTSITSDLNLDQCLKTRANALEKSMTQLKTSANNLGTLLNEAITDSKGKKDSLLSTLFPLYRFAFRGSEKSGEDSKTKRFINDFDLTSIFSSSKGTKINDVLGYFFCNLTPHYFSTAPDTGKSSISSLNDLRKTLTNENDQRRKLILNIENEISQFMNSWIDFNASLFSTNEITIERMKDNLLARTEQSKIATIYRIAFCLFSIKENSTVEAPNPEKTYDYIKKFLDKNTSEANKIAKALKQDPLSMSANPEENEETVDRSKILEYISDAYHIYTEELHLNEKITQTKGSFETSLEDSPWSNHSKEQTDTHNNLLNNLVALHSLSCDPNNTITEKAAALISGINFRDVNYTTATRIHTIYWAIPKDSTTEFMKKLLDPLLPGQGKTPLMFGNNLPQLYRGLAEHLLKQYKQASSDQTENDLTTMTDKTETTVASSADLDLLNKKQSDGLEVMPKPTSSTQAPTHIANNRAAHFHPHDSIRANNDSTNVNTLKNQPSANL